VLRVVNRLRTAIENSPSQQEPRGQDDASHVVRHHDRGPRFADDDNDSSNRAPEPSNQEYARCLMTRV